eukprot:EG_transcript_12371
MLGSRLLFLFGAAWLSLLTVLLMYMSSTLALMQQQQTTLLGQLRGLEGRLQAARGPKMPTPACPACRCQCQPPAPAQADEVPTPPCPSPVTCPPLNCTAQPVKSSSASCDRPEVVHPTLRWMGVDIGRDFFHHITTWSKEARRNHSLIVEVGAGDGRQAATTAKLGYRVISVDANKNNLALGETIFKSVVQNGTIDGNLTRIWSAVANYTGEAKFWSMSGMGRLLDSADNKSMTHKDNPKWAGRAETVPVNRLDDLVREVPWILKIDVEGHELGVMQGATRLLRQRPKIVIFEFNPVMMEWSAGSDPYVLLKLMHDLGYELYDGQISEPAKKGFVAKYGSMYRPTGFRALVDYFRRSKEFDWWGSWTDILAVLPDP